MKYTQMPILELFWVYCLLLLLFFTSSLAASSLPTCAQGSHNQIITASQTGGKGIGYDKGYTSLDYFWISSGRASIHPFIDLRSHLFVGGRGALNLGIGLRSSFFHAIFGGNFFYDLRQTSHGTTSQLGAGLENFYKRWNFHLNGYFPIDHPRKRIALTGGELLVGREIVKAKYVAFEARWGAYYLRGTGGGLIGLSASITPFLSLSAQGSYDPLFKGIIQGTFAFTIPFGPRSKKDSLFSCFLNAMRPVDRFEIIATKKWPK